MADIPFDSLSIPDFIEWLRGTGAIILPSASHHELVRFRARGGIHTVYRDGVGRVSAHSLARDALHAFREGLPFSAEFVKVRPIKKVKVLGLLLNRDGRRCFYCGEIMQDDESTIEHLVSRAVGGTNNPDNLVLVHDKCNARANTLSLVDKIKLRDEMRGYV